MDNAALVKEEQSFNFDAEKRLLKVLLILILILFSVSLYLGFTIGFDKKHILSLALSFLILLIVTFILFKVDVHFKELDKTNKGGFQVISSQIRELRDIVLKK